MSPLTPSTKPANRPAQPRFSSGPTSWSRSELETFAREAQIYIDAVEIEKQGYAKRVYVYSGECHKCKGPLATFGGDTINNTHSHFCHSGCKP